MKNDQLLEGGEPSFSKFAWSIMYFVLFPLGGGGLALFLLIQWAWLPVICRVACVLVILHFFVVFFFCARCFLGRDAFCFDHAVRCYASENGMEFIGVFSKAFVNAGSVLDVRRRSGWIILKVLIQGRVRHLPLAPWFENREQVVEALLSPPANGAPAARETDKRWN